MVDNDWSFHPGIGLGHLKFGMTPEEVQAFEKIYGKVTDTWKEPPPSEMAQKRIEEFVAKLEPELRKKYIEDNKRITSFQENSYKQFLGDKLELSYYEQRLYSISTSKKCKKFTIIGLPVFSSEPETVVLALAGLLKEDPLVDGSDLVFRESLVYVFGFTYGVGKNGKPLYYTLEGTERENKDADFNEREISWGTLPRNVNPEDWSKHVKVKVF